MILTIDDSTPFVKNLTKNNKNEKEINQMIESFNSFATSLNNLMYGNVMDENNKKEIVGFYFDEIKFIGKSFNDSYRNFLDQYTSNLSFNLLKNYFGETIKENYDGFPDSYKKRKGDLHELPNGLWVHTKDPTNKKLSMIVKFCNDCYNGKTISPIRKGDI